MLSKSSVCFFVGRLCRNTGWDGGGHRSPATTNLSKPLTGGQHAVVHVYQCKAMYSSSASIFRAVSNNERSRSRAATFDQSTVDHEELFVPYKTPRILGSGSITYTNGLTVRGQFRHNTLYEGLALYSNREERWIAGRCRSEVHMLFGHNKNLYDILKEGKLTGQGKLTTPSGDMYEGQFLGFARHGEGVLTYADGNTLRGQWEYGAIHTGHGVLHQANGMYEGEIQHGLWHGQGKSTRADGAYQQEGEFREGKLINGHVKNQRHGSALYTGEIKGGYRSGRGILINRDGSWSEGEFKDSLMYTGRGRMILGSELTFEGQWQNGVWFGNGKLTYTATNETLEGEFQKGKIYNGVGTLYIIDEGLKYVGTWENGKFTGKLSEISD